MLCGDKKYTKAWHAKPLMCILLNGLASFTDTGSLMYRRHCFFNMSRMHYGIKKGAIFTQ